MRMSTLAAVLAISTVSAAPAFAMSGFQETLTFVSPIEIDGTKMDNDLCLLQKESTALWMTYHTEPLRYVMAPDRCEGDGYRNLSSEAASILNGAGLLPDLPASHYHVLPSIILGFMLVLGGLVMVAGFVARIAGRK